MRTALFLVATVLAGAVSAPPAFADASASPGKNAAYASANGFVADAAFDPAVSVTLEKGKRKRVLEVFGSVTDFDGGADLALVPRVNGLSVMEPMRLPAAVTLQAGNLCDAGNACTASSEWWLDLDAAEAANPGVFVGQPLVVELLVSSPFVGETVDVSLRARLQKK